MLSSVSAPSSQPCHTGKAVQWAGWESGGEMEGGGEQEKGGEGGRYKGNICETEAREMPLPALGKEVKKCTSLVIYVFFGESVCAELIS